MSPDQNSSTSSNKHDQPPKFHLHFYDVEHAGVQLFMSHYQENMRILTELYSTCHSILYNGKLGKEWEKHRGEMKHEWKEYHPRTITVVIRPMDGVAYTTGKMIDDDHKEIHFNAEYILNLLKRPKKPKMNKRIDLKPTPTQLPSATPTSIPSLENKGKNEEKEEDEEDEEEEMEEEARARVELEIKGVLVHEMVHAIQYNGKDTCPGGLIEGIADWVRLRAGLAPPHWKPYEVRKGQKWDAGYSVTAYFLIWLEKRLEKPFLVNCINQALHKHQWQKGHLFNKVVGQDVVLEDLWHEYRKEHKLPSPTPSPPPSIKVECDSVDTMN